MDVAGKLQLRPGHSVAILTRDALAGLVRAKGVQAVRQVALDDVWSALRLRPA